MGVVVIGGGLAGCAAANRLTGLGHEVTLIEAGERVGGRALTLRERGFVVDTGATSILSFHRRTVALLRELGLGESLARVRRVVGFHDGEELHLVRPDSPLGYLALLGWRDRARLARAAARVAVKRGLDPFDLDSLARADSGETIAAWARRVAGEAAYQRVIRPNVESYFSFSSEEASAAFEMALLKEGARARFFCLTEGMDSLCERLAGGAEVLTNTPADRIELDRDGVRVHAGSDLLDAAAVVIATEAPVAARLLPADSPGRRLAEIPYAANTHVMLAYERDAWVGFPAGEIVPFGPGEHPVTRLWFLSRRAGSLVPDGAEVVNAYLGERQSRLLGEAEALSLARRALVELAGPPEAEPLFEHVVRRELAFPVPRPGLYGQIRSVREAMPPRARLAGDYLSSPGVEGAVRSGERAACEVDGALAAA